MAEKSLKKNAVLNIIKNIVGILYPLITFPYASRILNPNGIGQINFVNGVVDFFSILAGLGIASYAVRECSKVRENKLLLSKIVEEMFIINLISMAFSIFIFLFLVFFVKRFSEIRILFFVIGSKIVFESIGLGWFFNVIEDYAYSTIRSIILQILSAVFLFMFVKEANDVLQYAFVGIIYSFGCNTYNLFYVGRRITLFTGVKLELRKHLKGILVFFIVSVSARLYALIDSTMLGFLTNDANVGFYSAANKLINMLVNVIAAAFVVFLPRVTNYYHNNKITEYNMLTRKTIDGAIFFSIPATIGIYTLGEPLILLLSGEAYLPAVLPMKILCPQVIISSVAMQLQYVILIPQDREKAIVLAQNIACIVNICCNYFFILHFAVIGAVIASLISQVFSLCILLFYSKDYFFQKSVFLNCMKVIFSSVLMYIVIVIAQTYFLKDSIIMMFPTILIGMCVYAISTLLCRHYLSIEIIHLFRKKIKN